MENCERLLGFDRLDLSNPFGDPPVGSSTCATGSGFCDGGSFLPGTYDGSVRPGTVAPQMTVPVRSGVQDFSGVARAAIMASLPSELHAWPEETYLDDEDIESYEMRSEASAHQQPMVVRTQSMPSLHKAPKESMLPKSMPGVRHAPTTLYGGKTEIFSRIVDTTPLEYKVQFDSYMNRDKRATHFDSYMERDKQHAVDASKMSSQRTCLRPAPRPVGDFRSTEAWQRAYAIRERNRKNTRRRQPRQERPCVGAGPSIRMGRRVRIYNPAPTPITSDELICEPMIEDVCRSPHPNARDIFLADEVCRDQAYQQHGGILPNDEVQLPIPVNMGLVQKADDPPEHKCKMIGRESQLKEMQRLLGETWKQQQLGAVATSATSSTSAARWGIAGPSSPVQFSRGDDAQRRAPPPICSDFLEVRSMLSSDAPAPQEPQDLANNPYLFLGRLVATLPGETSPQQRHTQRGHSGEAPIPPQAVVECNFWQLREAPDSFGSAVAFAQRTNTIPGKNGTGMVSQHAMPPELLPTGADGNWNYGRANLPPSRHCEEDVEDLPPWPHEM